jgi:hypothetical protein
LQKNHTWLDEDEEEDEDEGPPLGPLGGDKARWPEGLAGDLSRLDLAGLGGGLTTEWKQMQRECY